MSNWGRKGAAVISAAGVLAVWLLFFGGRAVLTDINLPRTRVLSVPLITPVRFHVPYPEDVEDSLLQHTRAFTPIHVRQDPEIRQGSLESLLRDLQTLGADSVFLAGIQERDYYGSGLVDRELLRSLGASDLMVVLRGPQSEPVPVQAYTDLRESRTHLHRSLSPVFGLPAADTLVLRLRADLVPDMHATDSARSWAVAGMSTIDTTYFPGDTLLPAGVVPGPEFDRVFEAMDSAITTSTTVRVLAKLVPPLFLVALAVVYGIHFMQKELVFPSRILLLGIIWMASLAVTGLLWHLNEPRYHVVSCSVLGACLTAVFFGSSGIVHAWFLAMLFSALTALNSGTPYTAFLVSALPAVSVAGVFRPLTEKRVSLSGLMAVSGSILLYWALNESGINYGYPIHERMLLFLFMVPFLSVAVARITIHPVESVFRVNSPLTYERLLNDNHPLRIQLRNEAMGTYEHSKQVADLAEAAAVKLKADPILARIGGYYHDIGKLRQPGMFIENMPNPKGYNPLVLMNPYEGAALVINHVAEGVRKAKRHRFPQEVIDIIREHHGTGCAKSLLEEARKRLKPHETLNEKAFCYPGPRPRTLEAALVMTADAVSSAIRGLKDKSKDKVAEAVKRTLQEKEEAGEYDLCGLNRSKQEDVWHVFMDILNRTDYERVEDYPGGP